MALAAADLTTLTRYNLGGGKQIVIGVWTPSGTYTSGGEDLTRAIALAGLGLKTVSAIVFSPLVAATPTTYGATPVFDRASSASSWGKIHIPNAVAAHTHSFLVKGGTAAAGTDAVNIKATVIGKEAATDATNTGGANGGVQNNTAVTTASEAAGATDFSTGVYKAQFVAYGTH